ncbi:BamA/TamA family outer membrane protein [Anaeromyxobacter sp. Red801]|uniref:BamA/TamA family outer membrane protein n=1 Tax=Anaeromyxobacter sp. Red801 TaxID=3411632 RepID=UPI003BA15693
MRLAARPALALLLLSTAARAAAAPPPAPAPAAGPASAGAAVAAEAAGASASDNPPPAAEPGERTAETAAHPQGHVAAAEAQRHGNRWFALPVLFWLPETRLGFGATGGLHLDLRGAPRPSSVFVGAVYTLERQGSVDVAGEIYLPNGMLLSGRTRVVHFPDVFYGIGPHTTAEDREKFTRRGAEAVVTAELPVLPDLRIGPRVDLRAEEIQDREPGGLLARGTVAGWDGYTAAAAGASATYDTRDSTFWPMRGTVLQAWYVYAPAALGRRHATFGRGVAEARHFVPLGHRRVLGLHAYGEAAHGEPPFTLLPKLGSTRFLRGIREGRYRDRVDWVTQAELRTPVVGRLGAAAFAAVGDVAPSLRALTLQSVKASGGAGLRWRLTEDGANIRVDVAASRLGVELYVLVLEAF